LHVIIVTLGVFYILFISLVKKREIQVQTCSPYATHLPTHSWKALNNDATSRNDTPKPQTEMLVKEFCNIKTFMKL
jgi:hypothetical protein